MEVYFLITFFDYAGGWLCGVWGRWGGIAENQINISD